MKKRKYGDAMKKETLKQARKFQRHRPRAKEEVALSSPVQDAAISGLVGRSTQKRRWPILSLRSCHREFHTGENNDNSNRVSPIPD